MPVISTLAELNKRGREFWAVETTQMVERMETMPYMRWRLRAGERAGPRSLKVSHNVGVGAQ
jgi:hypothetical protein